MENIINRISKEQFDIAYDNHEPSAWIRLAYKYFSRETEKKDFGVRQSVTYVLLFLFFAGFLLTAMGLSESLLAVVTITYSIILGALVLYIFSAVFANNWRIKQIRKELGITRNEYDALTSAYY